jgi:hypothetical protein
MNRTERLAIAKVFHAAKLKLWDGCGENLHSKRIYICTAILEGRLSLKHANSAIKLVHQRLLPYATLEDWLLMTHGIDALNYHPMRIQGTRAVWLDSMIQELEA